jgi:hypothetical protein
MVPALLIMMLTLLCGFLPARNIVSEKEVGTIEQLNVTPLNKFVFILAKLVPYWIVGLVVLSIGLVLSAVLYGIVPSGSLWLIYFFSCIYILTMSGFGLGAVDSGFQSVDLFYSGHAQDFPGYQFWIANYNPWKEKIEDEYLMWQFTEKAQLHGIDELVDVNVFNGNVNDLKKVCIK